VDVPGQTLTVEAGLTLLEAQQAATKAGLCFPLSLAAEGSATVGGVLSTNAGGTQVLRYGNARALCLGLEVVTAEGELWSELKGLRKDNTGYALRELFIGAEGTLGLITAACLRLYPEPRAQLTSMAAVPSLEDAMALLARAQQQLGPGLTAFEAMNAQAQALLRSHMEPFPALAQGLHAAPWWVLLEQSDFESEAHAQAQLEGLMEGALQAGEVLGAVVASNLAQSQALWALRESIPLAQSREGLNIKHDIALPLSALAAFVRHTDDILCRRWPGCRLVNFGHLGDGNLHYNVQAPLGQDAQAFLAAHEAGVNQVVFDAVQAFGGSVSAEHGIGQLRREELQRRKSPVALQMMRHIKQALDPSGRFNPGKVLPHPPSACDTP
jgi:FAD/FMN-containing dehydrogenase